MSFFQQKKNILCESVCVCVLLTFVLRSNIKYTRAGAFIFVSLLHCCLSVPIALDCPPRTKLDSRTPTLLHSNTAVSFLLQTSQPLKKKKKTYPHKSHTISDRSKHEHHTQTIETKNKPIPTNNTTTYTHFYLFNIFLFRKSN